MMAALTTVRPRHRRFALCCGWLLVALVTMSAGQAADVASPPKSSAAPAATDHRPLKPRDDLPGLKNFAEVAPNLWRGAQPTAEGFAELKRRGVKTIVNLRWSHSDRVLLAGDGLQYAEIHCNPWHPEREDVLKFLKIVDDPRNQPVFVHCEHGADRTGMMVAAYRIVDQNWPAADAEREMPNFHHNSVFVGMKALLGKLDPEATRKKLDAMPAATIETVK